MTEVKILNVSDHSRDAVGLTYVYPVVSRRAGGVSVGINLNPNNACNWRCVYCQVPDLKRGTAPEINLELLETELRHFLQELLFGDFMQQHVPEDIRRINDIALSGNGEPTSAREFDKVVELIGRVINDFNLLGKIKLVLITNGSLIHKTSVQKGIAQMQTLNGEVWFKLDRATPEGMAVVNDVSASINTVRNNLRIAARLCPTWLQTCVFMVDDKVPSDAECDAYVTFVVDALNAGIKLEGLLLYGLARPSMQAAAARLSNVSAEWIEVFAESIRKQGLTVKVSP